VLETLSFVVRMFDLVVLNRRKRWEWRVSDRNGKVIMCGSEPTRQEAKYKAHRALFLLLSQAGSYNTSQTP
jgi:hypothetical protein